MEGMPRFLEVNDTFVKVDFDPSTDEVFGVTAGGRPFPPLKAVAEGSSITEADFKAEEGRVAERKRTAAAA